MNQTNPFAVTSNELPERGVFSPGGKLVRASFLYRMIEFKEPFEGVFVYTGWWFLQRVMIGRSIVWSKISWLSLASRIEFAAPGGALSGSPGSPMSVEIPMSLEIQFTRGLRIRRFRIWHAGNLIYDEIT